MKLLFPYQTFLSAAPLFLVHPRFILYLPFKTPTLIQSYNLFSPISVNCGKSYTNGLISYYIIMIPNFSCYHSTAHSYIHFKFHLKTPTKPLSLSEYDLSLNLKKMLLLLNMISFNLLPTHIHPLIYFLCYSYFLLLFFFVLLPQKRPCVPFKKHTLLSLGALLHHPFFLSFVFPISPTLRVLFPLPLKPLKSIL